MTETNSAPDEKRILLIHPLGYRKEAAGRDISRMANIMPPLGLASIAAYLEREGLAADIIDCYAHPDSDTLITDYIRDQRPAFIGLSCTTSSFLDGIRITEMVKAVRPATRSIFGGVHVSALREKVLADFPTVDFVVVGEGEQTLTELLQAGGRQPVGIAGVIFRDESGTVI
jgi:radical SAM superfamily enzyme YgiQ (UPF0313 family)